MLCEEGERQREIGGGGGNRTHVRATQIRSFYVRSSPIKVSSKGLDGEQSGLRPAPEKYPKRAPKQTRSIDLT